MGFDQMMNFYDHYVVSKCKCTVTFVPNSTIPVCVALSRNSNNVGTTNINSLVENGNIDYLFIPPTAQANQYPKLVLDIDIKKFQGVDDIMDDPELRGTVASNPTEQSFFHLSVWYPFGTSVVTAVASVLLEYTSSFVEPRRGTGS